MTPDKPDNATKFHSPDPSVGNSTQDNSENQIDASAPPDLSFLGPPLEDGDLGQLGTYRIRRILGVGGMGIVFEAIDSQLRRLVALKVMRPEIAASLAARTRFLKEARAAAALSSDHIVTVFQVGQDNDVPFMAMQLLRGEALDTRLNREPRLAVQDALTIAIQAAAGLAAAHDAGLIHRDIKPANLWLEIKDEGAKKSADSGRLLTTGSGPDTSFRVKILDLGLVRGGGGPRLTTAGVVVGTPHFMAPEQAGGSEIDHRADLFSLGCVIFTMLTGELAFGGNNTMAVLMALANHTPPLIHERNEAVPHELSQFVARMMSKTAAGRPPSALQVIEHLTGILDAENERKSNTPQPRKPGSSKVSWAEAVRRQPIPELKSRSGIASPATTQSIRTGTGTGATPTPADSGPLAVATPSPSDLLRVPPQASAPIVIAPSPPTAPRIPTPVPVPIPCADVPPPVVPGSGSTIPAATPPREHAQQSISVGIGLVAIAIAIVSLGLILGVGGRLSPTPAPSETAEAIKIGVLHSKTGSLALSESPVIDATLLAVDEVNQAGGVLGRQLQPIVVDGKSDPDTFAMAADKLLGDEKVAVVFGCWTSASRKAVKPTFERRGDLLFYPVHYEGLEQSPRIVYTGAAPNQQIIPAIDYLTGKLGKKRLFVVGSDYVYPRTASEIISDYVKKLPDVKVVGAEFVSIGSKDVVSMVEILKKSNPDAIVNLLNGTTNFAFFKELKAAGITAETMAIISTSITENELRSLDPETTTGSYLVASYFQSLDRPESREFVRKFQAKFGADRVVSNAMAAAYTGVHMWAKAANAAGKLDSDAVLSKLGGATFAAPGGTVKIDPENRHTWQPWRIGKVRADGQVDIVASSPDNIAPTPFPNTRTRGEWERFLEGLYIEWGSRWQAPSTP
ncbi:MAG: transporter substrate-binding protein [Planctomycetes bacterium]|nr:transporter substrate-binding protein [Planctomycetota bacterium]